MNQYGVTTQRSLDTAVIAKGGGGGTDGEPMDTARTADGSAAGALVLVTGVGARHNFFTFYDLADRTRHGRGIAKY